MGRKIRNYDSAKHYENLFNEYFKEHRYDVMKEILDQTHFDNFSDLAEYENHLGFGFDCGLVYGAPANKEMEHEWVLDNGKYNARFYCHNMPYNCQSTTLQKIQMDKAIKDLGLQNLITTYTWID